MSEEKKSTTSGKSTGTSKSKATQSAASGSGGSTEKKGAKAVNLVEKFQAATGGKKTKVEFVESPTGALNLGYHIGETASFTKEQADLLYDLGLAKPVK